MAKFVVNGKSVEAKADPDMPLLWVLREKLGLTGTKFGCGIAQCLACTVHIEGQPVPSCQIPVKDVEGVEITTIEGVGEKTLHPVQKAWIEGNVPQCGYCQSGIIMAAIALLEQNSKPSDAEIDSAIGNICRCGTYPYVRKAIHAAAKLKRATPGAIS